MFVSMSITDVISTDLSAVAAVCVCLTESRGYLSRTANLTSWLSSVRGRKMLRIRYSWSVRTMLPCHTTDNTFVTMYSRWLKVCH